MEVLAERSDFTIITVAKTKPKTQNEDTAFRLGLFNMHRAIRITIT